ncbi:MerR family DNA-binding transcriptional regulator [Candidatus Daviesbacteria bacterium]|nr:MerR family DNA-binding transcriptional regulator [Candidatus Daviesbacteria bacterium]
MSVSLPNQKKLISISGAAKFLGVSIDTVRRWDKSGILHSERPDGKNRFFSLKELEEYNSNQPLSISETAIKLGISPTTLRRLETKGIFKAERNNAGERVYDKDSIENFLKSDYFLRKKSIKESITQPQQEKKELPEKKATPSQDETQTDPITETRSYAPNFLAISAALFLLLVTVGTGNVLISTKGFESAPTPAAVLSETVTHEKPAESSISNKPSAKPVTLESIQSLIEGVTDLDSNEATQAAEEGGGGPDLNDFKIILAVQTKGAKFISIREKPSTESGKIDKARNGDSFEMVSRDSGWYEIKLNNGLNGFISEEFAKIKEIN